MRIVKYQVELDENRKNVLVKEDSKNCPEIQNFNSPLKVVEALNHLYNAAFKAEEYIWLIALDSKNHPIGVFEVSHGSVNFSLITPREIFVRLCLCGAASCILAYNHPSGDPTPSSDDINVTKRVKDAGEIMNIKLLDHVIIGEQRYYSFHENGIVI